ncbi:hypothetical protein FACS1894113_4550 [Alphaproteobacteria bacterium]|nr:hypothetical protein FACS1894113_4550 [Alphaproteobacteria bacterium]
MKITNILLTASLMVSPLMANRSTSGSFNVGVGGSIEFSIARVNVKKPVPKELEQLLEFLRTSGELLDDKDVTFEVLKEVPEDIKAELNEALDNEEKEKNKDEFWKNSGIDKFVDKFCYELSEEIVYEYLGDDTDSTIEGLFRGSTRTRTTQGSFAALSVDDELFKTLACVN